MPRAGARHTPRANKFASADACCVMPAFKAGFFLDCLAGLRDSIRVALATSTRSRRIGGRGLKGGPRVRRELIAVPFGPRIGVHCHGNHRGLSIARGWTGANRYLVLILLIRN